MKFQFILIGFMVSSNLIIPALTIGLWAKLFSQQNQQQQQRPYPPQPPRICIQRVPVPFPVEKVVEKLVQVPVEVKVPVHVPIRVPVRVPVKVPHPVPYRVNVPQPIPYPIPVYQPSPTNPPPSSTTTTTTPAPYIPPVTPINNFFLRFPPPPPPPPPPRPRPEPEIVQEQDIDDIEAAHESDGTEYDNYNYGSNFGPIPGDSFEGDTRPKMNFNQMSHGQNVNNYVEAARGSFSFGIKNVNPPGCLFPPQQQQQHRQQFIQPAPTRPPFLPFRAIHGYDLRAAKSPFGWPTSFRKEKKSCRPTICC